MNIYVIGFMGSGKSSLGKRLAAKMNKEFIDSDKAIEAEVGMSIAEIFEEKGEAFFRDFETRWLAEHAEENAVIALGGGTPCSQKNIDLILKKGLIVYLIVSVPALATRLSGSKSIRPLIEKFKNDSVALKEFISNKIEEREVYYKQAQIKFDGESVDAEKLNRLIELIQLSPKS